MFKKSRTKPDHIYIVIESESMINRLVKDGIDVREFFVLYRVTFLK